MKQTTKTQHNQKKFLISDESVFTSEKEYSSEFNIYEVTKPSRAAKRTSKKKVRTDYYC